MKKMCGSWAVLFLACALLMGFLAGRRILMAALPAGLIGGAILWLGVAYLAGIGDKLRVAKKIRRALNGEPPRDGEIVAVTGRIEPLGDVLTSPFGRESCVAYAYRVRIPKNRTTITAYQGIALTPSMIGSTKLLAWPELDVPEKMYNDEDGRRNALEFESQTKFTVAQMFQPDDKKSPHVRYDHRSNIAGADPMQHGWLSERVVRPGEEVCALGYYSASEGGLTYEPNQLVPTLKMMNGSPHAIRARLVRRSIGNVIGSLIFIAIAFGGMLALYLNIPLDAAEQMSPDRTTFWWEVRLERLIAHHSPNEFVPTGLDAGQARGRFVIDGREMRPTSAIQTGNMVSFDNGNAVATIESNHLAHFELLGKTIEGAQLEMTGDNEGRITYLGDDAKCRIWFNAAVRK